jgi:hypothetical protein
VVIDKACCPQGVAVCQHLGNESQVAVDDLASACGIGLSIRHLMFGDVM